MEEKAIKLITDNAIAAAAIKANTDRYAVVVPNTCQIQSLEHLMNQRSRFRGTFTTESINDFVAYAKARKTDASRCFVDQNSMTAQLIVNMGDEAAPGHCDDLANLQLVKTAPYKAILDIDGKKSSQSDIADFLEDWRDYLIAIDADENTQPLPKALQAIRSIDIKATRERSHAETSLSAEVKGFDKIEAQSKHQLPYGFSFTCNPFSALGSRDFLLRLAVLTGGDKPTLTLRIMRLEDMQEAIAMEFRDRLTYELGDIGLDAYIGSFSV